MVDCYYTFLDYIRLMIDVYYISWVMLYSWLITFMGYHRRLKWALDERSDGAEGIECRRLPSPPSLSSLGLNFRPSLESTPRRHHEFIFFSFHKTI